MFNCFLAASFRNFGIVDNIASQVPASTKVHVEESMVSLNILEKTVSQLKIKENIGTHEFLGSGGHFLL